MGRHSAPDEDEPAGAVSAMAVATAGAHGRHQVLDDPAETVATGPAAADKAVRREGGTHADLRLLRERPALRARCAAAVVVPFVGYIVVLLIIGQLGSFLLWAWIPTVTAGVSVGSFLDAAHRRDRREASGEPPPA